MAETHPFLPTHDKDANDDGDNESASPKTFKTFVIEYLIDYKFDCMSLALFHFQLASKTSSHEE